WSTPDFARARCESIRARRRLWTRRSYPLPLAPVAREEAVGGRRSLASRAVVREALVGVVLPVLEDRHDDLPGRLDGVPAREERRVAAHRVADEPFVRGRRDDAEAGAVVEIHRDGPDVHPRAGDLRVEAQRDPFLGLDL